MQLRDGALIQLYTAKTGVFDFHMDDSALVVTTAPVMAAGPGLVVKNYFGYHTAETFGFSEAAAMPSSGETSEEESDTQYDLPLIVQN